MARIFSADNYEPKYYGSSDKQKESARRNIKAWNDLRKKYGLEKAKDIAQRRRDMRKVVTNKEFTRSTPHGGTAAQDLFASIMDIFDGDASKEKIRSGYDSDDILDLGEQWIEKYDEDEYMDPDIAEELLKDYARILAE